MAQSPPLTVRARFIETQSVFARGTRGEPLISEGARVVGLDLEAGTRGLALRRSIPLRASSRADDRSNTNSKDRPSCPSFRAASIITWVKTFAATRRVRLAARNRSRFSIARVRV